MEQTSTSVSQLSDTDLRLLRLFQTVARWCVLTAAESELKIGRSTISRHLKDLEMRLGATLCHRGRSGFALTDEGTRVFDAAERLLTAVGQFHTEVEEINDRLRGRLRLALFDKTATNPNSRIAHALGDFARRAPAVDLQLHFAQSEPVVRVKFTRFFESMAQWSENHQSSAAFQNPVSSANGALGMN